MEESHSIQLIDRDGNFNMDKADTFKSKLKLDEFGRKYGVISIMGPQSGGKSTLLNNLFDTKFVEMDELEGREQTTQGVWMAVNSSNIPIIVLDVEGCDGRERGEDDTLFERQSALFNLAVSDVVLINIWNKDIGREQGASKPLLKTIFQVMTRLFKPQKTTLMFVVRDKAGTPLSKLESILRADTEKLWNSAPKSRHHKDTPMDEFFSVRVEALSNYQLQTNQFKEEVAHLKAQLIEIITSRRRGDRQDVEHASEFFRSTQDIWKKIKDNEDLDIPTQRTMLANTRCGEISDRICSSFEANEDWCYLRNSVQPGIVRSFGSTINPLLRASIQNYEDKTAYFDEAIRNSCLGKLKESLLRAIEPAWRTLLGHIKDRTLHEYKEALNKALHDGETFTNADRDYTQNYITSFDDTLRNDPEVFVEFANWDTFQVRNELQHKIDEYRTSLRSRKFSTLTSGQEGYLKGTMRQAVGYMLREAGNNTWQEIRELIERETTTCVSQIKGDLIDYGYRENVIEEVRTNLRGIARSVVESVVRENVSLVGTHMKLRFIELFIPNSKSAWKENDDIPKTKRTAYSSALELLSFYAAIRLDDEYDEIKKTLFTLQESRKTMADKLDSESWQDVPKSRTLITPAGCASYWKEFESETSEAIEKAIAAKNMDCLIKWSVKVAIGLAVTGAVVGTAVTAGAVAGAYGVVFLSDLALQALILQGAGIFSVCATTPSILLLPSYIANFLKKKGKWRTQMGSSSSSPVVVPLDADPCPTTKDNLPRIEGLGSSRP